MTEFFQLSQFILGIVGIIMAVVLYFTEKRRTRYAAVIWGIWCVLLVAYRVYRFTLDGGLTTDQTILLNSLVNTLVLLGVTYKIFLLVENIVGAHKHGQSH